MSSEKLDIKTTIQKRSCALGKRNQSKTQRNTYEKNDEEMGKLLKQRRLTFSYALLYKSYPVRSKAIVHELLHLRYPTHTKMFNSLLSAHLNKKGINSNIVKL